MPADPHDFNGSRLNFVQVGLGTNSTFIQNLAGPRKAFDNNIDSLLKASSETRPSCVKGIAVEPVRSLVESYRYCEELLPQVELLEAALGESNRNGVEVQSVTSEVCDALLSKVPRHKRSRLESELQYCLNMSCTGGEHPFLQQHCKKIQREFNVNVSVQHQNTEVWTWSRLVRTFNFRGCEVLLIDAEGNDAAILRSLIRHCQKHPREWPHLIQYESMGLCDKLEGEGTETALRRTLEDEGYLTVCWSRWNTYLVHRSATHREKVQNWMDDWYCTNCKRYESSEPFYSNRHGIFCARCLASYYTEIKASPVIGEWDKGTITATTLTRKTGEISHIEYIQPTEILMTYQGQEYTGTLHGDSTLIWRPDGQRWYKMSSSTGRSRSRSRIRMRRETCAQSGRAVLKAHPKVPVVLKPAKRMPGKKRW